jgi:alpha-N-arabinofuranosidase
MHITLVNVDAHKKISVEASLENLSAKNIEGEILTSQKFNDINTFDEPNKVKSMSFSDYKKTNNSLSINLPPMSVVLITVK